MMWDIPQIGTMIAIVMAVNGGFVWASKRLFEDQRDQFVRKMAEMSSAIDEHEKHIHALRDDLAAYKVAISEGYIRREDAIIYFGRFEQKLDSVWNHLLKIPVYQSSGG